MSPSARVLSAVHFQAVLFRSSDNNNIISNNVNLTLNS